jgi:3-hydroxypropanoate dehydrogenase
VNHATECRRFEAGDGSAAETAWLARLFTAARSHSDYRDEAVPEAVLVQLYELMKWGPTAFNSGPARIQFVRSAEAKLKLLPCLKAGNVDKVQAAPVTAIIGMDLNFPDTLPQLMPQIDARNWYAGNKALIEEGAFRNSSLQGGYFIMAARALGLDCGPMSGFDAQMVDQAFWEGTEVRTNFLCALGYGREEVLRSRNPRLPFSAACQIL